MKMKIKFKKKDFLKAIKVGGKFAVGQKVLPILDCVKITVVDWTCWILSYDFRNAIKINCPVESDNESIMFCINRKDIEEYVSLIDDESFEIDVDNDSLLATIYTSNGTVTYPLYDAKEFPALSQEVNCDTFQIDAGLLAYWIQKGAPFLINDDMQRNNENMHIFIKDGKIDVFFFNRDIMYHDSAETTFEGELKMPVNRNSFLGITAALSQEKTVTIKNGSRNIVIIGDDTMLMIRKDEFVQNNYYQLLNYVPILEITVDREKLLRAVMKAMNVTDNMKMGTITIKYSEGKLELFSERIEVNKRMEETIEAEGGKPFEQTYMTHKLRLALSTLRSEKVILKPAGANALLTICNPDYETEQTFISPCRE